MIKHTEDAELFLPHRAWLGDIVNMLGPVCQIRQAVCASFNTAIGHVLNVAIVQSL